MLEKNFDGRKFTVKAQDGTKLDCMFFPFNNEAVKTAEELKIDLQKSENGKDLEKQENKSPDYLLHPTVIFFNPNA